MINTTLTSNKEDPIIKAVREKLSERLKTGFIELIPQEAFNTMTDLAIDEFVNGPKNERFIIDRVYLSVDDERNTTGSAGYVQIKKPNDKYNPVSDSKTLPGMIYLELVKLAKENISKAVNEDKRFTSMYDVNVGNQVVPILNTIVKDNAAAFMQALMNNVVHFTLNSAINSLRNSQNMSTYIPPPPPGNF